MANAADEQEAPPATGGASYYAKKPAKKVFILPKREAKKPFPASPAA